MNTANKLTLLRVVMIPAFLLVLYLQGPGWHLADLHEPQHGRRHQTLVRQGVHKLAEIGVLVIVREFAVSGLRMIAADKGRVIAAGWSGKVKTASTMVCIVLMLLPIGYWVNSICVAVIVLTTIYSGVEYFTKNLDVLTAAE